MSAPAAKKLLEVKNLVKRFPSVSVFDVEAILSQIRQVMDRASLAVQYVFLFTVLAGIMVMLAAVQVTRDERHTPTAFHANVVAMEKGLLSIEDVADDYVHCTMCGACELRCPNTLFTGDFYRFRQQTISVVKAMRKLAVDKGIHQKNWQRWAELTNRWGNEPVLGWATETGAGAVLQTLGHTQGWNWAIWAWAWASASATSRRIRTASGIGSSPSRCSFCRRLMPSTKGIT